MSEFINNQIILIRFNEYIFCFNGICFIPFLEIIGQKCNCVEEYKWIKDVFEKNDAGYPFYLEKYGQEAIDMHNKKWEKEFDKTKDVFQCFDYLNLWIKFYRKGHLAVAMTDQKKTPYCNKNRQRRYHYFYNIQTDY